MVSTTAFVCLAISGVISLFLPFVAFLLFWRREKIKQKPVWIGVLIFFVFTNVEGLLNYFVLTSNHTTAAFFAHSTVLFSLYACLAAALFEETGRLIGYRVLLKRFRAWKDGVSYGIGHGGIEAVLVGALPVLQNIVYGVLINTGQFEQQLGGKLPAAQLAQLKGSLLQTAPYEYLWGGVERILAFVLQIGMSLLVLYAVKNRKWGFFLLSLALHALFDFLTEMFKLNHFPVWSIELVLLVFALGMASFIVKSKAMFAKADAALAPESLSV